MDLATAAFPIMPNLKNSKPAPPPRPHLQRSQSVSAISGLDEDKYGFPKLHKYMPEPEVEAKPRGRPTQRQRNVSESHRDLRTPTVKRSASVGPPEMGTLTRSASVGPLGGSENKTNNSFGDGKLITHYI